MDLLCVLGLIVGGAVFVEIMVRLPDWYFARHGDEHDPFA